MSADHQSIVSTYYKMLRNASLKHFQWCMYGLSKLHFINCLYNFPWKCYPHRIHWLLLSIVHPDCEGSGKCYLTVVNWLQMYHPSFVSHIQVLQISICEYASIYLGSTEGKHKAVEILIPSSLLRLCGSVQADVTLPLLMGTSLVLQVDSLQPVE